jgi:hypothetical protein
MDLLLNVVLIPMAIAAWNWFIESRKKKVVCNGVTFVYRLRDLRREQEEKSALSSYGFWVEKKNGSWVEKSREPKQKEPFFTEKKDY